MSDQPIYPIVIDLGTYSCFGVWRNERTEILPNEQGNYTTPSYVAFTTSQRFFGEAAANQAALNVCNTVVGVKRMIGRNFDEPQIQSDMRHWFFTVKNKEGSPVIEVQHQ